MKLIADLHIHSHYSRATSKELTFEHLAKWAQLKGVHVVGTGDISHPGWLAEMQEKLAPAEDGLYRLKEKYSAAVQDAVFPACRGEVRFLLSGEISSIYKRDDKTRKVHNVIFAPSLEAVARLQIALEKTGNIRSDGRPILGLDSRDLLEIVLDTAPGCHLIPAHIWTPWFSVLGSKSGFDSIEACYADLTPHIFALETGLSSDPPMNWRVSDLDRYTLVSNSDAHSPQKLAREANLFDTELSYPALFDALNTGDPDQFLGTIEFFPEEGKYHLDGHRKCGVSWEPKTTLAHDGRCSVCGRPVTVGVLHRVETLADRPEGGRPAHPAPFYSMIPLREILSEIEGVGPNSKRVGLVYEKLLSRLGPELAILLDIPAEEIRAVGGECLAEGITRMRRGDIQADGGYDGEFGVIRVFGAGAAPAAQMGLFGEAEVKKGLKAKDLKRAKPRHSSHCEERRLRRSNLLGQKRIASPPRAGLAITSYNQARGLRRSNLLGEETVQFGEQLVLAEALAPLPEPLLGGLNVEQREAAKCTNAPLIIVAGPGTGKTRTLTVRIAYLIRALAVPPEVILAITFTNKAAHEMSERLAALLDAEVAGRITIKTFHAFGAMLLREGLLDGETLGVGPDFAICSEEERAGLLKQACPEKRQGEIARELARISTAKNRLLGPDAPDLATDVAPEGVPEGVPQRGTAGETALDFADVYRRYEIALAQSQCLDYDDLIFKAVRLLEIRPDILRALRERFRWISVDEYQDVNLAQYRLLRLLTGPGSPDMQTAAPEEDVQAPPNLCVIGDPDQAIYGFRGADHRYFLAFQRDYPGARTLYLSRNYRSSQMILDAAAQVIAKNPNREAMQIWPEYVDQVKLDVYDAPTDKAEAEYVVHQIEQMVGGTGFFSMDSGRVTGETPAEERSFADFAVLYRVGAQSRLLVEAFERSGIPYQTAGQAPLHAQPGAREALAALWLLHTPRSGPHLATLLVADGTAFAPGDMARVFSLWPPSGHRGENRLDQLLDRAANAGFTPTQRARVGVVAEIWRKWADAARSLPVAVLIERASLFLVTRRGEDIAAAAVESIQQLALLAAPFGERLGDFLEATILQGETDFYDPRADRVALMTLHAAKGLEFPVVFIVGCEEGLLPYHRPGETTKIAAAVEEERRLFYVGMTRARQRLVLTHAKTRFLYGQRLENAPSRFVGDIEAALVEVREMARRERAKRTEASQLSLFESGGE